MRELLRAWLLRCAPFPSLNLRRQAGKPTQFFTAFFLLRLHAVRHHRPPVSAGTFTASFAGAPLKTTPRRKPRRRSLGAKGDGNGTAIIKKNHENQITIHQVSARAPSPVQQSSRNTGRGFSTGRAEAKTSAHPSQTAESPSFTRPRASRVVCRRLADFPPSSAPASRRGCHPHRGQAWSCHPRQ